MKFTYELTQDADRWVAECVESDAVGEGRTADSAIASLRRSLEERMFRPDAVAPPADEERAPIVLTPAVEQEMSRSPSGPGDIPSR